MFAAALAVTGLLATVAAAGEPVNFDGDYQAIVASIKSGQRDPVDFTRTIAPNVTHRFQYLPDKPWLINVVEVHFDQPPTPDAPLSVTAEAGGDALYGGERTSAMAAREEAGGIPVVCAINADFYGEHHRPVGLFVDDGHVFKNPDPNRPVFAVGASGRFYITEMTLAVIVTAGGQSFELDAVNPLAAGGSGAVFTPKNNRPVPFDPDFSWFRLKPRGNTFLPNTTALFDFSAPLAEQQDFTITDGEFVLAAKKDSPLTRILAAAAPGTTVQIYPKIAQVPEPLTMAVGGIPRLITDGRIDVDYEKARIGKSFVTTEHPRTAIGFSRDGNTLWLVTVDGRQTGLSRGIGLMDLAQMMLDMGCWQAVNLDGGGSTTMFVRGQIVNSPSDLGGERVVSNCIMLVGRRREQNAPVSRLPILYPQNVLLPTRSSCQFRVEWTDDQGNPVEPPPTPPSLTVSGTIGTITDNLTLLTSDKPAKGSVTVNHDGDHPSAQAGTSVETAEIDRIVFNPRVLLMRSGEVQSFSIAAYDKQGRRFFLTPGSLALEYPDFLEPTAAGGSTVKGVSAGHGRITVAIGEVKSSLPVAVDQFQQTIVESFDALPQPTGSAGLISGQLYDERATSVSISALSPKEGRGALKWTYSMKHGGTTAINLNLNVPIPDTPLRLGIWVWGDGKGAWLRSVLEDVDGERFLIDWTGSGGIFWKDNWRFLEFNLDELTPYFDSAGATPNPPFKLTRLYLAQQKEADKASGEVRLDGLSAIYAPRLP
ncbi:MAG: hypothetical protein Kow0059_18020 [Candidatus Sumerlaeia bacterium]